MPGIRDFYTKHAARFDEERTRNLMERPYLDAALERMPHGARVLDLGCGTGEPLARYFVERGCDVTGIDAAAPMIELCRTRFPGGRWLGSDMRGLDLGERFDLVIAWDSSFHLGHADQRGMFATFECHAAPGSLLLFTSRPHHGEAIGDLYGDPLYHASLAPDEYRRLHGEHGYEVITHRVEDPDYGQHTVWLAIQRGVCEPGAWASPEVPRMRATSSAGWREW